MDTVRISTRNQEKKKKEPVRAEEYNNRNENTLEGIKRRRGDTPSDK